MKKGSIYISLVVVAFLYSSCNLNNLSIAKRQYRSGYFINRVSAPVSHKVKLEDSVFDDNKAVVKKNVESPLEITTSENFYSLTKARKKENYTANLGNSAPQRKTEHIPSYSISVNSKEVGPSKMSFKNRSSIEKIAQASGDARSILWTIAVVILIIWLIAILTGGWGMGGLVNLLLIAALVVFILWLLRVI